MERIPYQDGVTFLITPINIFGKRHGYQTVWKRDNLLKRVLYQDGKEEGKFVQYFDNGNIRCEKYYKNGKLNGPEQVYWDNGKFSRSGKYINGKREGTHTSWYENGNILRLGNFKNDIHVGVHTTWLENGVKKEELDFDSNKVKKKYKENVQKLVI